MIPIGQLKEFIKGIFKDKYDVANKFSLMYVKRYTMRLDDFKIFAYYQPPTF